MLLPRRRHAGDRRGQTASESPLVTARQKGDDPTRVWSGIILGFIGYDEHPEPDPAEELSAVVLMSYLGPPERPGGEGEDGADEQRAARIIVPPGAESGEIEVQVTDPDEGTGDGSEPGGSVPPDPPGGGIFTRVEIPHGEG